MGEQAEILRPPKRSHRKQVVAGITASLALLGVGGTTALLAEGQSREPVPAASIDNKKPANTTSSQPNTSTTKLESTSTSQPKPTTTTETPTTTTSPETTTIVEKTDQYTIENWPIKGSPEDQAEVRSALSLIQSLDDQSFWESLNKYSPTFEVDDQEGGIVPATNIVTFNTKQLHYYGTSTANPDINEFNRLANIKYVASLVAHEVKHDDQFATNGNYVGEDAEKAARVEQKRFLTDPQVNAPSDMVAYMDNEITNVNNGSGSY
jgi:hypothetical protein